MKPRFKRILCVMISIIMIMSILPLSVFAACSHSYTKVYTAENENMHSYLSKCTLCGEEKMGWGYSGWLDHVFSGGRCLQCGFVEEGTSIPANPGGTASVSLSAFGPSGTLGAAGGEIASETVPASYTVTASASGCTVTRITYLYNGQLKTAYGSSVTITANSESEFTTTTFTAYTDQPGVTATFTVNFKYVRKSAAYIMWETSQEAVIRSITGNGLNKTLAYSMTIPNSYDTQGNLTADQTATIQNLIGRNDGLTYMVNYTRTIRVYTPAQYSSTGQKQYHATYDGNNSSEIAECLAKWGWTTSTRAAIQQAASSSLSFTTSRSPECTAIWIDTTTNQQLYTKSFGSGTVSASQSAYVSVSYTEYPSSGSYVFESLAYSGDRSGTSTSQTYSQQYTAYSSPLTVTFYCHPQVTTPTTTSGTITVIVRDAETNAAIAGASVSCAYGSGTTDGNGSVKFNALSLGSYTFTAAKSGYNSNSGNGTISASSPTTTVVIYLTKNSPVVEVPVVPTNPGKVTVYVCDASTYTLLSSAYVSGNNCSGYTNGTGYVSFSELALGNYTFTASKSGYYSNTGSVTITNTNLNPSITIYLTPITTVPVQPIVTGTVNVCVRDASTGALINGALVTGAGTVQVTNFFGFATFSPLSMGSYSFTAAKSGYIPGSGAAILTAASVSQTVTIYLIPQVTAPTTGNITVYVKDAVTGANLSGASISGGGYSGSTNALGYAAFNGIPFGSYTFTAEKTGYEKGTGSATISSSSTTKSVTIYLTPIPTSGTITVYVKDASTGAVISGASVSSGSYSGSTNNSGYVSFSGLSFGSYTFSASKSGYSSNSGSASISTSATTNSVTIYLTKLPTSGTVTVTVRDKDTNAVLSGATVSGGGYSGTTNTSGSVSFNNLPFNTYTFTASLSGYDSNTGSATISATSTTKSITIYLSKKKADVGVVAEAVYGTVYRGSTIMVSADVYGDAAIDFTPSNPLTVTMKATRNGGTVFDTQTKSVICPKGETNLVWFTVDIPETGYTSADVTFTFTVMTPATITDSSSTNDVSSKTVTTYVLPDRSTPDASFELDQPNDFTNSTYKTNNNKELSWSVWEWNGGFVERTYTAKLTVKAELTPDATAVWSKYNTTKKLWTTRSGYGLNTAVTVSLTGVSSDMYAGNAKVNAYYPEFNYSTATEKSNMLLMESENASGYSALFAFDANADTISGSAMHLTPVWFPDGEYSVKYAVYDIWTPAGMLTSNTYALINIEGSMYDDYYTQRS